MGCPSEFDYFKQLYDSEVSNLRKLVDTVFETKMKSIVSVNVIGMPVTKVDKAKYDILKETKELMERAIDEMITVEVPKPTTLETPELCKYKMATFCKQGKRPDDLECVRCLDKERAAKQEPKETKPVMFDNVTRPMHYTKDRKYEPKDIIRDWGLNYNLGAAVKYISRAGRKNDTIEDLKKARTYLGFEIEALEAERERKS